MDVIYVPVVCADGLYLIPHTPEQYEALWAGVDSEAAHALEEEP